jgi:hypothetical protein
MARLCVSAGALPSSILGRVRARRKPLAAPQTQHLEGEATPQQLPEGQKGAAGED